MHYLCRIAPGPCMLLIGVVVRGVMTHNSLQADPASSLHSHTFSEHHFQCDYFKASVGLYG